MLTNLDSLPEQSKRTHTHTHTYIVQYGLTDYICEIYIVVEIPTNSSSFMHVTIKDLP